MRRPFNWSFWLTALVTAYAVVTLIGLFALSSDCHRRGGIYVLRAPVPAGACVQPLDTPEAADEPE